MGEEIERLRLVANKPFIGNRDINDHIITTKMGLVIIENQDQALKDQNLLIKILKDNLSIKELELKKKEQELKAYKEIVNECHKIIAELKRKENRSIIYSGDQSTRAPITMVRRRREDEDEEASRTLLQMSRMKDKGKSIL